VVQAARPQVFVIENVDRFRRSTEFALLLEQADHGVIADYTLTHGVLQATLCTGRRPALSQRVVLLLLPPTAPLAARRRLPFAGTAAKVNGPCERTDDADPSAMGVTRGTPPLARIPVSL
jgi:hypothetical protein